MEGDFLGLAYHSLCGSLSQLPRWSTFLSWLPCYLPVPMELLTEQNPKISAEESKQDFIPSDCRNICWIDMIPRVLTSREARLKVMESGRTSQSSPTSNWIRSKTYPLELRHPQRSPSKVSCTFVCPRKTLRYHIIFLLPTMSSLTIRPVQQPNEEAILRADFPSVTRLQEPSRMALL